MRAVTTLTIKQCSFFQSHLHDQIFTHMTHSVPELARKYTYELIAFVFTAFLAMTAYLEGDIKDLIYVLSVWGIVGYFFYFTEALTPIVKRYSAICFAGILILAISQASIDHELLKTKNFIDIRDIALTFFIACLLAHYKFAPQTLYKVIAAASLYSLYCCYHLITNDVRRGDGMLSSAIPFGNIAMSMGILTMICAFQLTEKSWRAIAVCGAISCIILSILTTTRISWLAFLLATFTIGSTYMLFERKFLQPLLFTLLLTTFAGLLVATNTAALKRIDLLMEDVMQYSNGDWQTSIGYRLEMWKAAWLAFKDAPLQGHGLTNFPQIWQNYGNGVPIKFVQPHNDFLRLLSETGLIGFLCIAAIILYPLGQALKTMFRAIKTQNRSAFHLSLLGLTLVECILVFAMTDITITSRFIFSFYFVLMLLIVHSMGQIDWAKPRKTP